MALRSKKKNTNLCQSKGSKGKPTDSPRTTFSIKSPAKINLTLDILGRDKNGYHLVDTIMQEIGLADELTFIIDPHYSDSNPAQYSYSDGNITLECDDPTVPLDESNTIIKAIMHLKGALDKKRLSNQLLRGLIITLKKNIPVASGLGGGSSNAATTLKALNRLWNLNLSPARLRLLAAKIGMDAPFFIEGGTAHCSHYGEKVRRLPAVKLPPHLIIMDDEKSSTKEMYAALDSSTSKVHPPPTLLVSTSKELRAFEAPVALCKAVTPPSASEARSSSALLLSALKVRSSFKVSDALCNNTIFDPLQSQKTRALQKKLLQLGATVVHTCGSGPALYALFESEMIKRKVYKELKGNVGFIWQNQNKN